MTATVLQKSPSLIDWSASAIRNPGESSSGDMHLVESITRGVLIAAVDGLGHGGEAAAAARLAISTLRDHANEGVSALISRCHQKLKGTRGAVMSLISFDGERNEMRWLGVGNVAGILVRSQGNICGLKEGMLVGGGVVGYRLPRLKAQTFSVRPGDTIAIATDGISPDFAADVDPKIPPKDLAARLCDKYATHRDDAMMLVARYLGWGGKPESGNIKT